jgi:hypothetical protein
LSSGILVAPECFDAIVLGTDQAGKPLALDLCGAGHRTAVVEIAMMGKLPYTALEDGVFAHPALAEGLNTLFMSLEG